MRDKYTRFCEECLDFTEHSIDEISLVDGREYGVYACQRCGNRHMVLMEEEKE